MHPGPQCKWLAALNLNNLSDKINQSHVPQFDWHGTMRGEMTFEPKSKHATGPSLWRHKVGAKIEEGEETGAGRERFDA